MECNNSGFPSNPENGEIYIANNNLAYKYDASLSCWKRLTGIDNVKNATISEAGLMESDDFIKVDNILVPSFDTTISGEECETQFREGLVKLISSDGDIEITEQLKIFNPNGVIKDKEFIIHNNTIGLDFRISIPRLIEELENRGNLKYLSVPGPIGDPGDRGDPGEDRIEAGPDGEEGIPGLNAPFPGSLVEDLNASLPTNKAVVDIRNDENDPSKIIVTVGNIGNPGVGPKYVSWKQKNSSWIMGLSSLPFDCNQPPECVPTGNIFYIDVAPTLDKIKEQYDKIAKNLKEEKEAIAKNFVENMASVFAQQRQAVCCALESVISRKVNQNIRNIWSNGRYQAAQAGYAFRVSDSITNEQPRNIPQQYAGDFLPQNQVGSPDQNVVINGDLSDSPIQFDCSDCYIQVEMNRTNIGASRSVKVDLPAYDYVASVTNCCIYYDGSGGTGVFNVAHTDENGNKQVTSLNDRGLFPSNSDKNAYIGDSLSFRHFGGTAEFFLNAVPSLGTSGSVVICVQPSSCFQTSACVNPNPVECDNDFFIFGRYPGKATNHVLGDETEEPVIVYDMFTKNSKLSVYHPAIEDDSNLVGSTSGYVSGAGTLTFDYDDIENKGNQILVVVNSQDSDAEFIYSVGCTGGLTGGGGGNLLTSYISSAHAEFYERGWRTQNCCGALVEVGDNKYIIVFRSIGLDCSCGGAEYENTPFIKTFKNSIGVQVAVAWPTINDETFFGLPRGDGSFMDLVYDKTFSDIVIEKIKNGEVLKSVGDTGRIAAVVAPSI